MADQESYIRKPDDDEDVEGHGKRLVGAQDDEDVEGHGKRLVGAQDDEDDVEGHRRSW
jgi:hypothetical protein